MKIIKSTVIILAVFAVLALPAWWYIDASREENDPDFPAGTKVDMQQYLAARSENVALLRGFDTAKPDSRAKAIVEMETKEQQLAARGQVVQAQSWKALGPAPIPNGQTTGRTDPVSGRVISIAVHPTNPNTVYVGTAQGGLYRSLDGGSSWVPLMDNALSLAIGSIAIAPSDPTTVFVGTGEAGFCRPRRCVRDSAPEIAEAVEQAVVGVVGGCERSTGSHARGLRTTDRARRRDEEIDVIFGRTAV